MVSESDEETHLPREVVNFEKMLCFAEFSDCIHDVRDFGACI